MSAANIQAEPRYLPPKSTIIRHAPTASGSVPVGPVPCDVLPDRVAAVHDNFSGCNFCIEVVELFKKYSKDTKYFSIGTSSPMHHVDLSRNEPQYLDLTAKPNVGIGVVLEWDPENDIHTVKRFLPNGPAALSGYLQIGDVVKAIDGRSTRGVGQSISNLISGPEGTFVELIVERSGRIIPPFRIRRTPAANQADKQPITQNASSSLPESEKVIIREEVNKRIRQLQSNVEMQLPFPSQHLSFDPNATAWGFSSSLGVSNGSGKIIDPQTSSENRQDSKASFLHKPLASVGSTLGSYSKQQIAESLFDNVPGTQI